MSGEHPPGAIPPEVMAAIKQQFFLECDEHLAELERGLLALQDGQTDQEIINTIFRAAHSVKGGAAMFGVEGLVKFAHRLESALAHFRSKQILPTQPALKVFLRATDVLADLVRAAREGSRSNEERVRSLETDLQEVVAGNHVEESGEGDELEGLDFEPKPVVLETRDRPRIPERDWVIRFRPHAELYANANEPLVLLRELERLGHVRTSLHEGAVPLLGDLNPSEAYLAWTISLHAACDETAIRDVFDFVEGSCELEVEPETAKAAAPSPSAAPDSAPRPAAPDLQQTGAQPRGPQPLPTIRVDLERVDRLINLVSELVISEATLTECATAAGAAPGSNLMAALDDLRHLTRDVQESVMAIRAQPVKSVFQRMPRLVRELETATGKPVRLITQGEETEIDRSLIEGLGDPLTHMLRNAIDHGIESPDGRLKANKPAQGVIRVSAAHRAGRIVIEVVDDGAGINRERVRAIALERGLIRDDLSLSDEEVDNLIFEPGFSTAKGVTEISGRGVGMDVVKRSVQALGGRVSVSSRAGEGTTFTLSLPLTLAVLDGMLVIVRGQELVVPLTALLETVHLKADNVCKFGSTASLLSIHGKRVPVLDLGSVLDYSSSSVAPTKGVGLLVEGDKGEQVVLLVDEILGQRQIVIKSLETNYHAVEGIAAATVLGNGRVALILDVNAIMGMRKAKSPVPGQQAAYA